MVGWLPAGVPFAVNCNVQPLPSSFVVSVSTCAVLCNAYTGFVPPVIWANVVGHVPVFA